MAPEETNNKESLAQLDLVWLVKGIYQMRQMSEPRQSPWTLHEMNLDLSATRKTREQ